MSNMLFNYWKEIFCEFLGIRIGIRTLLTQIARLNCILNRLYNFYSFYIIIVRMI